MQLHVHKAGIKSIINASFDLNKKKLGETARQTVWPIMELWSYSAPRMKWLDFSFAI